MKVSKLIEILSKCDPEADVYVWDALLDGPSFDVHVSVDNMPPKDVHIGKTSFGEEVS